VSNNESQESMHTHGPASNNWKLFESDAVRCDAAEEIESITCFCWWIDKDFCRKEIQGWSDQEEVDGDSEAEEA
jgi:hypothetical protein